MASSVSPETSACQLCSNTYTDPRILSCLHSFCLHCISGFQIEGQATVKCPSCNNITAIPSEGLKALPANTRLDDLSRQEIVLKKIISPASRIGCSSCEEEASISIAYCTVCEGFVCSTCVEAHNKMKVMRSHLLISLQDAVNMDSDKISSMLLPSTRSSMNCSEHESVSLDLYCKKCNCLICGKCVVTNHKGHSVVEVSDEVESRKKEIRKCVQGFPKGQEDLLKTVTAGKEMKEQIRFHKNEVDNDIKNIFKKLQEMIKQREKALLDETNQLAMAKETRLCLKIEQFQSLLELISECHSFATAAMSEYSDIQFLSVASTLQSRGNDVKQQINDTSLDLCETPHIRVTFIESLNKLTSLINDFGSISEKYTVDNSAVIIPRYSMGVLTNMAVKVIPRDSSGSDIKQGVSVSGLLSNNTAVTYKCPITELCDGAYVISVVPKQEGKHQLHIAVNGVYVRGSPFSIAVLPQRNYTKLKEPKQRILNISSPVSIAFSQSGDIFVSSNRNHCIYVFKDDSSNYKLKSIIGSLGTGELQFQHPCGIDINEGVVYVAEYGGDRIQKLTTGGKFLAHYGTKGYRTGQFRGPQNVKVGPNGRIYVAEIENNRIQVFDPDWTVSHVIYSNTSFSVPEGIAFDLRGNVYITGNTSHSVVVFSPNDKLLLSHTKHIHYPSGIAVDPFGNFICRNYKSHSMYIYDPSGKFIHSIDNLNNPLGVTVSVDGSIWIADTGHNRILKY